MKTSLITLLATAVSVVVSIPVTGDNQVNLLAKGLFVSTIDSTGKESTTFTPLGELPELQNITLPATLSERSTIERRRDGCLAGASLDDSISDAANSALINSRGGINWESNGNTKHWITVNGATSFICAYSGGWKPKTSIQGTWDWVKRVRCGNNRLGYGQVQDGSGDWTAGYTVSGDGFCW